MPQVGQSPCPVTQPVEQDAESANPEGDTKRSRMASRRLPSVFYNWISVAGAQMSVVSFSIILLLYLMGLLV